MGIKVALLLSIIPLILLGITSDAFAGVGQAGSNPSGSGGDDLSDTGDPNHVFSFSGLVSACDPVTDCAPIVKTITITGSGEIDNPIMIQEDWEVGPGPDWWDWHEVIQENTWLFTQVQISSTSGAPCPQNPPEPPLQGVIDLQEIWIDFADVSYVGLLTQGDHLCIWKEAFPIVQPNNQVVIWEWPTIHKMAVGGELIPLDTTMVLLAGTQTTAAWMIPVIVSGIGIAIVIARKF